MIHDFASLNRGDWPIQNAANSGAGQSVIQIAHELGFKTVNVVRRAEVADELRSLGADVVLVDGENLRDEVADATDKAPIRLALNAVGGENALRVVKCLLGVGRHDGDLRRNELEAAHYSERNVDIQNLRFTGFWVNKWYDSATPQQRAETFEPIFEMAKRGLLRTKVEATYALSDARAAVAHASQNKRNGKNRVLF